VGQADDSLQLGCEMFAHFLLASINDKVKQYTSAKAQRQAVIAKSA
jgi:hypothetical protein